MTLQTGGPTTARRLAVELEVSERTIYRDLQALNNAGVPVYTERGPGGGVRLVESYRTSLTGLTRDQVRALFMLSIPAALAELGLDQELKAALLKLSSSLPASLQPDERRVRQRIYIDLSGDSQPGEPLPHLRLLQQAVWDDRRLYIKYRSIMGEHVPPLEARVCPYGLVAKSSSWYLVNFRDDRTWVVPVKRILEARVEREGFTRLENFDLAGFWRAWWAENEALRQGYPVRLRLEARILHDLLGSFGGEARAALAGAAPTDDKGWLDLTLVFEYLEEARSRLLGFGRSIEVLEPLALRLSMQDYARQVLAVYKRQG